MTTGRAVKEMILLARSDGVQGDPSRVVHGPVSSALDNWF
jgi:hypothetical protein